MISTQKPNSTKTRDNTRHVIVLIPPRPVQMRGLSGGSIDPQRSKC